ncbi:MAG: hypothetical protein AAF585_13635 [Verrucomicrobiota bacterium]
MSEVIQSVDASEEPTAGQSAGSSGAVPTQSASGCNSRIAEWASKAGSLCAKADFSASLDGPQIERELVEIVRETPEFGRSLSRRIVDFMGESSLGDFQLIGGGGEAIVLFDGEQQRVVKFSALGTPAKFGWVIAPVAAESRLELRSGELAETLLRFANFERLFRSGLEIDSVGEDGAFLLMQQPFIRGEHPSVDDLNAEMHDRGWEPFAPESESETLRDLSWRQGADTNKTKCTKAQMCIIVLVSYEIEKEKAKRGSALLQCPNI